MRVNHLKQFILKAWGMSMPSGCFFGSCDEIIGLRATAAVNRFASVGAGTALSEQFDRCPECNTLISQFKQLYGDKAVSITGAAIRLLSAGGVARGF